MSDCFLKCCKNKKEKEKEGLYYNKTRIGGFGPEGYSGISKYFYTCLGSKKAHDGCILGNSKDIFISQNDNSEKEISIFIELDKHNLLSNILSRMPLDCEKAQIVFIFKEDSIEDHKTCKKAQQKCKGYDVNFFACQRKLGRTRAIQINTQSL